MAIVGSASVKIVADTSNLLADIEKQLGGLDRISKQAGKDIGKNLRDGIKEGMGDTDTLFNIPLGKSESKGKEAGASFGMGFIAGAKPHFTSLANDLGKTFGADMAKETNSSFTSNLNIENAVNQQLSAAGKNAARDLSNEVETGIATGAEKGSKKASSTMGRTFSSSGKRDGDSYGKGFSGSIDKWLNGRKKSGPFEESIAGIASNIVPLQILQGALAGVVSAASAAAGGIVALGSALVYAAPAALQFANVLAAMAQGFIVAKTLFSGVGEGIKAYGDSQKVGTSATQKATKATKSQAKALEDEEERLLRIREARDALNDAIIEGARANEDAVEAVSDAQESYSDALEDTRDAQEAYNDAIEDQSDAQRDLADAIEDEEKALRDLNQARDDALERLEDLSLELERASLNEERAALNLKKAEQELANARAGGNANAIYEADLAYREQLQSVKELQESNGDLRDEANKAQSEGVDGTQDVIDAQRAHRDAVEATSDAQEALNDAIEATSDAQEGMQDATEAVSDAQRELGRAIEDVARIAEDVSIRIARAQLNLKKAMEGTAGALAGVGAAGTPAAAGLDKVATAFDKLSPAAQDFVRFIVDDFLPPFEEIKKLGQEEFFPRFQQALESIIENDQLMQMLQDTYVETSKILGDLTIDMAAAFQTPESMAAFQDILESNEEILKDLGAAATSLIQPFLQIFQVTAPYAEEWSESVKDAAQSFEDFIAGQAEAPIGGGQSPLEKFFENADRLAGKLWEVLKNVGGALLDIFEVALPAGEYFLDRMIEMTDGWSTSIEENKAQLTGMFFGAAANAADLLSLVGAIGEEFMQLGSNPALGELIRAAEDLVPVLGDLIEDGFNQIAPALERILTALEPVMTIFSETGTIETFANTMATVVEHVAALVEWFMGFERSDEILGLVGTISGIGLAVKTTTGLLGRMTGKVTGLWDAFKGGVDTLKKIGTGFSNFTTSVTNFSKRSKAGTKAERTAIDDYWKGGLTDERGNKKTQKGADEAGRRAGKDVKTKMKADQAADQLTKDLKKAAEKEARELEQIGRAMGIDVSNGLEEGLKGKYPELVRAGNAMGVKVIDAIKEALGVESPSWKTRRFGKDTAEGVEEGLEDGTAGAVREADQMSDKVINELKVGMADGGDDAGDAAVRGLTSSLEMGTTAVNDEIRELVNGAERTADAMGDIDLNVDIPVGEAAAVNDEVRDIVRGAEKVMPDIDLNVDIPITEQTDINSELRDLVRDAERVTQDIDLHVDIPITEKAKVNAEVTKIVLAAEATANRAMGGIDIDVDTNADIDLGRNMFGRKKKVRKNDAGELIDKKGRRISNKGDLIDGDGNIIDKKGDLIDADGNVLEGKRKGKRGKGVKAVGGKAVKKGGIKAASAALAATPIPGARIVAGLATAGTALYSFGENAKSELTEAEIAAMTVWDTIGLGWSTLWQGVSDTIGKWWESLSGWWNNTVVPWWNGIWESLSAWVSETWADIAAMPGEWWASFMTWWDTTVVAGWNDFWNGIGQGWSDLWASVTETISGWWDGIVDWWNNTVVAGWNDFWEGIGESWSDLWNGVLQWIKDWWNLTFMPWLKGLPDKAKEALKTLWDIIPNALNDAWTKIKDIWNDQIWPWIKGIPQKITDGLKGAFNGLASGFFDVIESIADFWNDKVIANLEKLPFVDDLPNWTFTRPAGYAEGGVVQGPDQGPKADNVLAALTPGEYVLTRRMVSEAGVGNLEAWRRGVPMGGRGGSVGDALGETKVAQKASEAWNAVKDWSKEKLDQMKDMAAKGAMALITPILKGLSSILPNNKYLNKFIDWLIGGDSMKKWSNGLTKQAEAAQEGKENEEKAKAEASAGGNVPPYDGPENGWAYPLSRRVTPRTYSGHRNTGAYDFAAPTGTSIFSVTAGQVIFSKSVTGSYGQHIKIRHKNDTSLYAHMSERIARGGAIVRAGQLIGKVGSTGNSTGPHLHLEISPPKNTVSVLKSHGVKMARGGIVPATPGGMLALIGEAGRSERVTPLDNQGRSATEVEMLNVLKQMAAQRSGGGDTFNVFPAPGMNERELAGRVSRQVAIQHRRRS